MTSSLNTNSVFWNKIIMSSCCHHLTHGYHTRISRGVQRVTGFASVRVKRRRWTSNVVGERRTMSFNFGSIWKIRWLLSSKCNREQRGLKVEKNAETIAEKNNIIYYLKENLPIMVWVLISFECNVLCNYYMTKRPVAQSAFVQESVSLFCMCEICF